MTWHWSDTLASAVTRWPGCDHGTHDNIATEAVKHQEWKESITMVMLNSVFHLFYVPSLSHRQTIMLWTMTKHGVGDDTRCSLGADDVMTLQGVFSPVSTTLFQIMTEISLIRSHSYNICQFCVTFQDMTNNFAVKLSLSVYWRICLSWSDCHISVTIFPAIIFGSPSVPVSKLKLVFLPLLATCIAAVLWIISFTFAA